MLCHALTLSRGVFVATLTAVGEAEFALVHATVRKLYSKANAKAEIVFALADELAKEAK
ncbi:MAG TPA: hypothetical protein VEF04_14130 [Blastocatellia bacterium]|nr:hypothetical protein [Blastocatellia bacterium]